ncbi:hypothetical protein EDEG_00428 [Edhazardia aedis USNM 41457]|uniref:N-acetyltransferase domain-containing protein n=1 Tax=Edhazardia aedis (strain USNM 41457) TaxID=1003232 RepID=J9DJJ1_EDHAE|nr:hypothetical protein EDEG_00428 [Edhazardia aedis USNM 41457]|eukprot:EJW01537.1 hypothetical protein EDEG_00428 [Edhazardia aedis USNM 41457]
MLKLNIELKPVSANMVSEFQIIHNDLFNNMYRDTFYKAISINPEIFSYFITKNDEIIGVISYRLHSRTIYLMSFAIKADFRGKGYGKTALNILELHVFEKHLAVDFYLHVHIGNLCAFEFYKKSGFEIVKKEINYYKKLYPRDAYLLYKEI